jgi:hypothetical protein
MKKHIIGLALFSFIVSAAAIVYALFNVPEIVPVSEVLTVSVPRSVPARYSCKMKRNNNSVKIRQAVLDLQTKQFNWELATPEIDEPIALHFFSNDDKGARYITSERINNKFSHNGILKFSNSYGWLNKRKSYENLYVIAQFDSEATNYSENYQVYGNKFQPKFDAAKATAVTIDYGE